MTAAAVHPRLAARRARKRHIRQTVVALTVALFIATWALIFGTLASGHDPALSSQQATTETTTRKSVATYPSSTRTGASSADSSQIDPSGQVWDNGSGTTASGSGSGSSSSGSGTSSGSSGSGSSGSGSSGSGSSGSSGSSSSGSSGSSSSGSSGSSSSGSSGSSSSGSSSSGSSGSSSSSSGSSAPSVSTHQS